MLKLARVSAVVCVVTTCLTGHVAGADAAAGDIATVAGNGSAALSGDEGPATSAALNRPQAVVLAPAAKGGYYVADNFNHVVRWVDAAGQIHAFAGTGQQGFGGDGGPATSARLNYPRGLAVTGDGSVLIADTNNSRIRRVAPDGTISTFAGNGTPGFSGDNDLATSAQLCFAGDIAVEATGGVLIADSCNNRIREVGVNGTIRTVAGTGAGGFAGDGGNAEDAILQDPQGVAVLPGTDDYVIADTRNNRIRQVDAGGTITTLAGTGAYGGRGDGGAATAAELKQPQGVEAVDSYTVLIPDTGNQRIRSVNGGTITTLAGTGARGFSGDGGSALTARLDAPYAVTATPDGRLLIADEANNRIRAVDSPVVAPTRVVNTAADSDDGQCEPVSPGHDCSLRDAINAANGYPFPTRIEFYIFPGGHQTISLSKALPAITKPVTIDGTTQPGFVNDPVIEISGTPAAAGPGLDVRASSTIQGLAINNIAGAGVHLTAGQSVLEHNYIGTSADGLSARGNQGAGVLVSSAGNTIGGPVPGQGNVISGNTAHGVRIDATAASDNVIAGNVIGLTDGQNVDIGNASSGVLAISARNAISDNVISGNGNHGIHLDGAAADDNVITGNEIGTDWSGNFALGNDSRGIVILNGSEGNRIGGTAAADRNVISGNGTPAVASAGVGVLVDSASGDQSHGNQLLGNYVGIAANGTGDLGNEGDGVRLHDSGNSVGGSAAGAGNVISGNGGVGVALVENGQTSVRGNRIGTDATGESAVQNATAGVGITSRDNAIGDGTTAGANIISGNRNEGVWINGAAATGNTARGNRIGTDDDGQEAVPNGSTGVTVTAAGSGNVIGGTAAGQGNLISGNTQQGVLVDTGSGANSVTGNFVGTIANGTAPLPNNVGVAVTSSASNTVSGNVLSGNRIDGVQVLGEPADGNVVRNNRIGTDDAGNAVVANGASGVFVSGGADDNTIGGTTAADRNVISGNGTAASSTQGAGVVIDTTSADEAHGNRVLGNYIGIKANGRQGLGNESDGVRFGDSGNSLGTGATGAGNVVSGNGAAGIVLTAGNSMVLGNTVGADATGTFAVGNGAAGVQVSSNDNAIGDGTAGGRNVISGNLAEGVDVFGGNANAVIGNLIGTTSDGARGLGNGTRGLVLQAASDNLIGGAGPGQGNVISDNGTFGVSVLSAGVQRNRVIGNRIGTDIDGEQAIGNRFSGVIVQDAGTGNVVGGRAPGERNVISGNGQSGVRVFGTSATVQGNYVGTDDDGVQAVPNGTGISVTDAHDVVVGGAGDGEGNVLSGNKNMGVWADGTSTRTTVQGNRIGVGSGGQDVGNEYAGVYLRTGPSSTTTIGGTGAGEGNEIAFNDHPGVGLDGSARSASVRGNSIHSNDGPGIDLGDNGVTPNDDGDADSGQNDRQNFPDVAVATSGGGSTTVYGTLHSKVGETYSIDLYSDTSCDPSGNGEARTYLGSVDVTTDAGGSADFSRTLSSELPVGRVVTATASDSAGNTSELSACRAVTGAPTVSAGDASVREDAGPAAIPVTLSGPSARPVTVHYATGGGTATAGSDYTPADGTLTFAPGETTKTVSVPISDDSEEERQETVGITLSDPHEATIADGTGVVSIADDDPQLFVVNTTTDSDDGACTASPGNCSLREALGAANAQSGSKIEFEIGVAGAQTIAVASPLPAITKPVTIDGRTQPGFVGLPLIEVTSQPGVQAIGLDVEADTTIRGLAVNGFSVHGILLGRGQSTIQGNYLGVGLDGRTAKGNGDSGIVVGSPGNVIGGTTAAERNVISGNGGHGVLVGDLNGQQAEGNAISGNYIGTDATGSAAVPSAQTGVWVASAGTFVGPGNVISGNGRDGVVLYRARNSVRGNLIGTDGTGTRGVGNGLSGVYIGSGAEGNVVGGSAVADRNVIAANGKPGDATAAGGVVVDGQDNRVLGNYIGTKADGRQALGNEGDGVWLRGPGNQVGGSAAGEGNVVAANGDTGVRLAAGSNSVLGNRIGVDPSASFALGNNTAGVAITSDDNAVGDGSAGGRNVISGNRNEGVWISGGAHNTVRGNRIGTRGDGAAALANGTQGVTLLSAPDNRIGGDAAGEGNVVSGNGANGILLTGAGATRNNVYGNLIGTDDDGHQAVPNGSAGIQATGAPANVLGGGAAGQRNVISANGLVGVFLTGAPNTIVRGNRVGTDVGGNQSLGNFFGIIVQDSDDVTIGGSSTGEGNIVAASGFGVLVVQGSLRSTIQGNSIGVGTGETALGNSVVGVGYQDGAGSPQTLGGTAPGAGNRIANNGTGVWVNSADAHVAIRGNSIYSNKLLGIDLKGDGVTANDAGDSDSGPDDLQNFPSLSGATTAGGSTFVRGTLRSKPNQTYTVDFYAGDACDSSGVGEGQRYLGSADVTTDGDGVATIAHSLGTAVPAGNAIAATATDSAGNTSEFGSCAPVAGTPSASVADATVNEDAGTAGLAVTLDIASAETVTVDYATSDGTATHGEDYDAASGTLTFAPGETTKVVTVPVTDDATDEEDETFQVALSNPSAAAVRDGQGVIAITDNDAAPVQQQPQIPAPQQPAEPQQPSEPRDAVGPKLTLDGLVRRLSRARLLKAGLGFTVTADEPVSLDVTLLARPRMVRDARSGDVVIARSKYALAQGERTVKLNVLRKLRARFTRRPATLRLSIVATDAAGNRTRATRFVAVR